MTRPNMGKVFTRILKFREGARYCKMDLHTHTPASECSSFTLPTALTELIPDKSKYSAKKWQEACMNLLDKCAKGKNPFRAAYGTKKLKNRPRLASRPKLDATSIKKIAELWLHDIKCLDSELGKNLKKSEANARDSQLKEYLGLAIRDIRNYLASLFFPEEYVLRCYSEGIELSALTDHNHPGYIVPRLPELGTWYDAINEANQAYVGDLRRSTNPGKKVREVLLARLRLANKSLRSGSSGQGHTTPEIEKKHAEKRNKKLKALKKRRKHVEELIEHWKTEENIPRPLTILPGTEITVSNVHVLCIFPPQWYVPGRIGNTLSAIGIPEEHWGRGFEAAASSSVQDTIDLVDEAGGIAIPAHSNSDFKGLLRLFKKGLALTKVIEHPALLAFEKTAGPVIAKDGKKRAKDTCETLKWLDSASRRKKRNKPLCFVKGSDAHECRIEYDGTGEDIGARFSYVKMDIRPNDTPDEVFRSLRLALSCGQSRVIEHPTEDGYNYTGSKTSYRIKGKDRIKLIDWANLRPTLLGLTVQGNGSYADGLQVRFSPYLNCVIGNGGKSTLVRLVAYAFGVQGFWPKSKTSWLPELVRVYWLDGEDFYCVERRGRSPDPWDIGVEVRWYERVSEKKWKIVHTNEDKEISKLKRIIDLWPPAEEQGKKGSLSSFEDKLIDELTGKLQFGAKGRSRPLLVNQPREIFDGEKMFRKVLSKPHLKDRQVIWSTGSPNVPTSLDAEKIIVTAEKSGGKQMELICGGDLHEDEIRDQFVDHFEGGWPGFVRRVDLYTL